MHILLAVLQDFYIFFKEVFTSAHIVTAKSYPTPQSDDMARTPPEQLRAPLSTTVLPEEKELPRIEDVSLPVLLPPQTGYVHIPGAFLYVFPTKIFDGVMKELPFGTAVTVRNTQGSWAYVSVGSIAGWLQKESITDSIRDISPNLRPQVYYDADQRETIIMRTLLDDMFHAAALNLPFQDVEYAAYKLKKKDRSIAWPLSRPRIAGTWQQKLKGVHGVHIGVTPKAHAIMEYLRTEHEGHVAYVESVYPDQSMTITEVGYVEEGFYTERTLTTDEWKALRPVFISVS